MKQNLPSDIYLVVGGIRMYSAHEKWILFKDAYKSTRNKQYGIHKYTILKASPYDFWTSLL